MIKKIIEQLKKQKLNEKEFEIKLQEELNNSMSLVKEGIETHINNITN